MTLVDTKTAAEILGRSVSTLAYWRSAGIGPAYYNQNGRIRYDERDLKEFLRQCRREPSVRAALERTNATL